MTMPNERADEVEELRHRCEGWVRVEDVEAIVRKHCSVPLNHPNPNEYVDMEKVFLGNDLIDSIRALAAQEEKDNGSERQERQADVLEGVQRRDREDVRGCQRAVSEGGGRLGDASKVTEKSGQLGQRASEAAQGFEIAQNGDDAQPLPYPDIHIACSPEAVDETLYGAKIEVIREQQADRLRNIKKLGYTEYPSRMVEHIDILLAALDAERAKVKRMREIMEEEGKPSDIP